jgi:poly-gamma-glutamate capsule biosynthesis protein CapA/YwtB (metallophosphatase superfamily)
VNQSWTVVAVGDAIIGTRIAHHDHDADTRFAGMCALIRRADVASVNLETNLFDLGTFAGWPAAERGGSYLVASPVVADDLVAMGFDMFARANNHAGDWGIEGMLATGRALDDRGIPHCGIGRNLAEASRPVYLDTVRGRVAMVSLTTTFPVSSAAADQRPDIVGRPGCNAVAVRRRLELPPDALRAVRTAADGYGDPGLFKRANLAMEEGAEPRIVEELEQGDVDRVLAQIEKAAAFADLVLVNGHTHEPANHVEHAPAWLVDFARRCVDAGANAYLGHGPHILRGAEIHADRPIFHSLGNFVFHRDTQDPIPAAQYPLFGLDPQRGAPHEYVAARDGSKDRLSMTGNVFYESLIPSMTFREGRLADMELHPIELSVEAPVGARGTPRLATGTQADAILERFARLSRPGLEFAVDEGVGRWQAGTR